MRNLAGVTAIEIALSSGINRSQLSMYESGALKLSEAQLARLRKALRAALYARIEKLKEGFTILDCEEVAAQKEAVTRVGAPRDGFKGRSGDDAPNHAG